MIIRVGSAGGIRLFNGSPGSVQLIVDVTGYIASGTPTEAGAVVALTPARIVDSRIDRQIVGPLPMLGTADMQIGGQGGIPLDGVAGVVATLTVVDPQEAGYLTLWPSGGVKPDTSSLDFQAGETIATTVIVPVSSDFALRLFNGSFGAVQVKVDVTGCTLSGTRTAAGTWILATERIADSRSGLQIQADIWVPVRAAGLNNITAIAGGFTGCGLRGDALVTAWGYGFFGQLGNGGTTDSPFPVQVGWLANATALAGGMFTGYAPRADGTAWAWGDGEFGQLGQDLLYNAVPCRWPG